MDLGIPPKSSSKRGLDQSFHQHPFEIDLKQLQLQQINKNKKHKSQTSPQTSAVIAIYQL